MRKVQGDFLYYLSKIHYKIVTPCFDSLAIRQIPYTKYTSSQHQYAPEIKG